jgi:hypothetical protein
MPSAIKISQSKGDWVLENFRISIGNEDRVVQTSIENPNQFEAAEGFNLLPKRLYRAWPKLVHLIRLPL